MPSAFTIENKRKHCGPRAARDGPEASGAPPSPRGRGAEPFSPQGRDRRLGLSPPLGPGVGDRSARRSKLRSARGSARPAWEGQSSGVGVRGFPAWCHRTPDSGLERSGPRGAESPEG